MFDGYEIVLKVTWANRCFKVTVDLVFSLLFWNHSFRKRTRLILNLFYNYFKKLSLQKIITVGKVHLELIKKLKNTSSYYLFYNSLRIPEESLSDPTFSSHQMISLLNCTINPVRCVNCVFPTWIKETGGLTRTLHVYCRT